MKKNIKKFVFMTFFLAFIVGIYVSTAYADDSHTSSITIDFTADTLDVHRIRPQKTGVYNIYFSEPGFEGTFYWCDSSFSGSVEEELKEGEFLPSLDESVISSSTIDTVGAWINRFYMVSGKTYYFVLKSDNDCTNTLNLEYYSLLPDEPTVTAFGFDSSNRYTELEENDLLNNAIPGVSWNKDTYTLTLDNVSSYYLFYFSPKKDLGPLNIDSKDIDNLKTITIDIKGHNSIESNNKYTGDIFSTDLLYDLNFTGEGTLHIVPSDAGTVISSTNIRIDGPSIDISPRENNQIYCYLIASRDFIVESGRLHFDYYPRYIHIPGSDRDYILYPRIEANNILIHDGSFLANYHDYTEDTTTPVESEPFFHADNNLVITGGAFFIAASERIFPGYDNKTIFRGVANTTIDSNHVFIKIAKPIDISSLDISIKKDTFAYTGKEIRPEIRIPGLTEGLDFIVTYANNIEPGTATLTITPKNEDGLFTGSKTINFQITNEASFNVKNAKISDRRYYYRIIKPGSAKKAGTVSIIGLKKKSLKTIRVVAKIRIKGISYKVVSVGKNAFKNNKKITKVIIGKNVKKISSNAFRKCKKLKKVVIKSKKLKKVAKTAFKKVKKNCKFTVPKKKRKAYKKLLSRKVS